MSNKTSPFQLMVDPAEALAAAKRLRSHLPPYSVMPSLITGDDDEDEPQRPQEAGARGA